MSNSELLNISAFYTPDHIEENASLLKDVKNITLDSESPEFDNFFEVDRIVNWIKENGYSRTALQLPDSLLSYSVPLALKLEKLSESKMFILADTSYRSCCIDAVAAEHSACDSLVHFGEACLSSPTENIPVLYVFGKFSVDFDDYERKLKELSSDDEGKEIIILYESGYNSIANELFERTKICFPNNDINVLRLATTEPENSLGRQLPKKWNDSLATLIFIGSSESALLPIWLITHTRFDKVYIYSPDKKTFEVNTPTTNRQLRKRLFCIEKLKDANVVGLVIGTLGIGGVKEAITRVRKLCKEAQKKLYVLSIGKVNEPKLSNFANDIDCFILLSCPFGIILDSNQYFKPIVSLFEAEIALNSSKDWYATNGWTAEFKNFVNDEIGKNDNSVDVSLISGKIRSTILNDDKDINDSDKQLLQYSAGNYFKNRTWKGLDNEYIEEDLSLSQGLKGIPMEYSSEPTKQEK